MDICFDTGAKEGVSHQYYRVCQRYPAHANSATATQALLGRYHRPHDSPSQLSPREVPRSRGGRLRSICHVSYLGIVIGTRYVVSEGYPRAGVSTRDLIGVQAAPLIAAARTNHDSGPQTYSKSVVPDDTGSSPSMLEQYGPLSWIQASLVANVSLFSYSLRRKVVPTSLATDPRPQHVSGPFPESALLA